MKRWFVVMLYAIAMAWVEAAVVYYLRVLIDRINPYQPNPLSHFGGLGNAEIVREIATMMMLVSVGYLAGTNTRTRFAYFIAAFGLWDIFYYVFLRLMTGWPPTPWDWDVLFLVPLPWWGPVLAPGLVAALMVVFGTLVSQFDNPACRIRLRAREGIVAFVGVLLVLYVFMADAVRLASEKIYRIESFRAMLPNEFNWTFFIVGFCLMCAPVIDVVWRIIVTRRTRVALPHSPVTTHL